MRRNARRGLIQHGAQPAPTRRRPQEDAVPTANRCQLQTRPSHCHSKPFQGFGRRKRRKIKVAGGALRGRWSRHTRGVIHPPLPLDERASFFICTGLFDNLQEDAAEHLAAARSVPLTPIARSASRAQPLSQQSAMRASSGRTALQQEGAGICPPTNREFIRQKRERIGRIGSLTQSGRRHAFLARRAKARFRACNL